MLKNVVGHYGRVKRLTVASDSPGLVWSGGEDEDVVVRQWDMRKKWSRDKWLCTTNRILRKITQNAHLICY